MNDAPVVDSTLFKGEYIIRKSVESVWATWQCGMAYVGGSNAPANRNESERRPNTCEPVRTLIAHTPSWLAVMPVLLYPLSFRAGPPVQAIEFRQTGRAARAGWVLRYFLYPGFKGFLVYVKESAT